jgi:O-antigen ligase
MKIINYLLQKPLEIFLFFLIVASSVFLLTTQYYYYAVIPGIAIIIFFLLGRYPQIGYYLIIFLIPFTTFRGLSESQDYLTISKFVGFWLIVVIFFYFLMHKRGAFNLKSNLWVWFIVFFVVSLISTFISDYTVTSVDNLRKLFVVYIIFAITLFFIGSKDSIKKLSVILIISITVSSLLSIIGYIFNISFFAIHVGTESLTRGTGAAGDPNVLASTVVFVLPLLSYWFFSTHKLSEKSLVILLFVINTMAIIATYSRSGAIAFTVVLVLLFIENRKKLKPIFLGIVTSLALITIATTLILTPESYWERQKSVTEAEDTAMKRRISYLYVGWDTFIEHPIIGSGPGTFREIYAKSDYALLYPSKDEPRRVAHNTYVEVLTGTGILGFIFFFTILLYVFRNFFIAEKRSRFIGADSLFHMIRAYRLSTIALLISFLFLSSFDNKYLWIVFALSQVFINLSEKIQGEANRDNYFN